MNLRQYRRSEVVQAGQVIEILDEEIQLRDAFGSTMTLTLQGIKSVADWALVGDWILLHPDGSQEIMNESAFTNLWEPVGGPILS